MAKSAVLPIRLNPMVRIHIHYGEVEVTADTSTPESLLALAGDVARNLWHALAQEMRENETHQSKMEEEYAPELEEFQPEGKPNGG